MRDKMLTKICRNESQVVRLTHLLFTNKKYEIFFKLTSSYGSCGSSTREKFHLSQMFIFRSLFVDRSVIQAPLFHSFLSSIRFKDMFFDDRVRCKNFLSTIFPNSLAKLKSFPSLKGHYFIMFLYSRAASLPI